MPDSPSWDRARAISVAAAALSAPTTTTASTAPTPRLTQPIPARNRYGTSHMAAGHFRAAGIAGLLNEVHIPLVLIRQCLFFHSQISFRRASAPALTFQGQGTEAAEGVSLYSALTETSGPCTETRVFSVQIGFQGGSCAGVSWLGPGTCDASCGRCNVCPTSAGPPTCQVNLEVSNAPSWSFNH